MAGKDGRFYGAAHHSNADNYVLEEYVKGAWHTVRKCTKQGGANAARAGAQRDGHPYRVWNETKKLLYVECK